ncbi:MAG: hypothetical protein NTU43_05755 [Bacteroidetes bacterium]|nr:hypothetical protein [Bacteroidota bacterium]
MNIIKKEALVRALQIKPQEHTNKIYHLIEDAGNIANRPDWLWHCLLVSAATLGNANGYIHLILNSENYELIKYDTLISLEDKEIFNNISFGFNNAKLRYANNKINYMVYNFNLIKQRGGLVVFQDLINTAPTVHQKIAYLKLFKGIGDKYARNIMMDKMDPLFINNIAIDSRLQKILTKLEVDTNNQYEQNEALLAEIAKEAFIPAWELDRLLYNFNAYYLNSIS